MCSPISLPKPQQIPKIHLCLLCRMCVKWIHNAKAMDICIYAYISSPKILAKFWLDGVPHKKKKTSQLIGGFEVLTMVAIFWDMLLHQNVQRVSQARNLYEAGTTCWFVWLRENIEIEVSFISRQLECVNHNLFRTCGVRIWASGERFQHVL
jgi:hypothetical protein